MKKYILVLIVFAFISNCQNQNSNNLDKPLLLYYENKIPETIKILEQMIAEDGNNIEQIVWLAQSYMRLGDKDSAEKYAKIALSAEPCNNFAHLVYANSILPDYRDEVISHSDSSWHHYLQAVECDSTDPNIWVAIWGESIKRSEPEIYHKAIAKLFETGFLTKAELAYGRWMLRTLPPNAVLITNGDMDTYPAQAVQEVENFRKDVSIVERGLLDITWSIKFLRDFCRVPLNYSDSQINAMKEKTDINGKTVSIADQIFDDWIARCKAKTFIRPLTIAPTVDPAFYNRYLNSIVYAGSHFLIYAQPVIKTLDMEYIKLSLDGISNEDFSGPWVSKRDLSPIRTIYTKNIVKNISESALIYCDWLISESEFKEAREVLNWLEQFEKSLEIGSVFTTRISELKKRLK